jgi:bis(5'-nucleosyl)-tetraphosphatase (symmetrical)
VTRYAIGDVQGCEKELRALLKQLGFSADRDQLWFVGDLVNRGPGPLATLRLVRALGANAVVVLGNHDLHLLAVACGAQRRRKSDTLEEVLDAPDREALLAWLMARPLAHAAGADLMVHAGLVPQWDVAKTLQLAAEVHDALERDPRALFDQMYGNEPERWDEDCRAGAALHHQRAHAPAGLHRRRARGRALGASRHRLTLRPGSNTQPQEPRGA